jgi:archaellum component FlaC
MIEEVYKKLKDELGTVKADLQQDLKSVHEIAKKVSYLEA